MGEETDDSRAAPPVSVLICSKNRRVRLEEVVALVRRQEYAGDVEIVVVEETDAPSPIQGTHYLPIPVRNLGVSFARNHLVASASHELIAFIDDDSPPHPGWLAALVAPLRDPAVRGVAGGVALPPSGPIGRAEHILGFPGGGLKYRHRSGGEPQPTIFISTLNAAYRKSAVLDAGGFPTGGLFSGEDQVLAARVCEGSRCLFVPDAVVEHPPRGSLRAVARWFFNRGRSSIALGGEIGWAHVLRMLLLPKAVGLAAVFALLASSVGRSPAVAATIGAAAFFALSALRALWRHRFALGYADMGVAGWLAVAPVKLVMDLAFDFGAINQKIFGRTRT